MCSSDFPEQQLRRQIGVVLALCIVIFSGCSRRDPPEVGRDEQAFFDVSQDRWTEAPPAREATPAASGNATVEAATGTLQDNLPFVPSGKKLGSIAWRTWIYTDVGPRRTRFGYLRAGAVVDRRGPPIRNEGCRGGWYRVNPRGFVCIGKGATLDLNHAVLRAAQERPKRGEGLPYVYALSRDPAPYLYFRLPTGRQMRSVEGAYEGGAATWFAVRQSRQEESLMRLLNSPPENVIQLGSLPKPYGVESGLRQKVHAGQASEESGFAVVNTFVWEKRVFGLTTELDLIPMDRTKLVKPSLFQGVELDPEADLRLGVVMARAISEYEYEPGRPLKRLRALLRRTFVPLEKRIRIGGVRYWLTKRGTVIPDDYLRFIQPRTRLPTIASGTRKWVDVSLKNQTLVAYEGKRPVFATLISGGAGGLGDPEEVQSTTIQGTFMVHSKEISSTMNGEEDDVSDNFNLRDVPFVQYFHRGFALHGAYWHNRFGRARSHGCVNLSPKDSAWLFEWSDPHVPVGWHGVVNKERGTVVIIHP